MIDVLDLTKVKMKKSLAIIMIFATTLLLAGCSSSESPQDYTDIAALRTPAPLKINKIRAISLKQTARGLAAQAGLAWRARQIDDILARNAHTLDHIFDFNNLMLDNNVLPPVLVEGRNTLHLNDPDDIRVADETYQIVFPPRFVTAPPTWRDYIWMPYSKPNPPHTTLLPKNRDERALWNYYVAVGWNDGVHQADEIFLNNLGRLKRDVEGMILYRKLLAENMVSPPYVSKANLGVTGGGNSMNINDRILRITAISALKPNPKVWNPVISGQGLQDQNGSSTRRYRHQGNKI